MIFLKRTGIITLKDDTRPSGTWSHAMWLPVLQKRDVMPVMVSVQQDWLFSSILEIPSTGLGKHVIEDEIREPVPDV